MLLFFTNCINNCEQTNINLTNTLINGSGAIQGKKLLESIIWRVIFFLFLILSLGWVKLRLICPAGLGYGLAGLKSTAGPIKRKKIPPTLFFFYLAASSQKKSYFFWKNRYQQHFTVNCQILIVLGKKYLKLNSKTV